MKLQFINIFFIIIVFATTAYAQEKPRKKIEEIVFKADGVCNMCKSRIEDAAIYTPGVKFAEWNKETQMLKIAFKTAKVDEATIHKNVAAAGHDTAEEKAPKEAYDKLPGCCKYRDGVKVH
ncbi:MAG: heavy-metal-associated domain-containing protein [Cyclobacteriaceae bacterium]